MFDQLKSVCLACVIVASVTATPAASRAISDDWTQLGFARDGNCELTVTSSGKTLLIGATGLLPGERLRLRLSNGTMKPLDWRVLANRNGAWSHHYVPFLWNHRGGTVTIELEGSTCGLSTSVPWSREIRVIP